MAIRAVLQVRALDQFARSRLALPLVAAVALAIGLLVGLREYRATAAVEAAAQANEIGIRMGALQDRLATRSWMARATGAAFVPPVRIGPDALAEVDPRILRQAGDVFSFVWLPRVLPWEQARAREVVAEVAGERRPFFRAGFQPIPPQELGEIFYPVLDVLPKSPANLKSLGLSPLHLPLPRAALERAIATRDAAATAPLTLVQLPGEPAVVVYVPVGQGQSPDGFIGFSFRVQKLIGPLLSSGGGQLPVRVHDRDSGQLLHADAGTEGLHPIGIRTATFAGRSWDVRFYPPPASGWPLRQALLAGGLAALLVGTLLAGLVLILRQNARLGEALAAREAAEARLAVVARELTHRIRNLLALAQALAMQSFRGIDGPSRAALDSYSERLAAMAKAADLLATGHGGSMADVIAASRLAGAERIVAGGPPLMLGPEAAQSLVLIIHELSTNAIKHGALKGDSGSVQLEWTVDGGRFRLGWRETGVAGLEPPTRAGFGRQLLERIVPAQLGGRAELRFGPEGLSYALDVPLEKVAAAG